MIPKAFGAPRLVRRLNIAAVGVTLAAATASIFGAIAPFFSGFVVGIPTLLLGLLWAWVLRFPNTVGRSKVRWGWLASVPLAAANAALAGAGLVAVNEHSEPLKGALLGAGAGATLGIFMWGPALVLTLLCFGAPIAWSQRLARRGSRGRSAANVWSARCARCSPRRRSRSRSFTRTPRVMISGSRSG